MKRLITKAAAVAVLSASFMLAQGSPRLGHDQGDNNSSSGKTPDVATIVAREVNFLTHFLTLTTGQQTQATTLFTNALNSITPIEATITTARTALSAAIKANNTTAITTQSTAIGTAEGQITAIQATADAAFFAMLTTDQQTKLSNLGNDFFGLGLGGVHIPGGH